MASTKAILVLKTASIPFEVLTYKYDPNAAEIGMYAASALGISPDILLKTLMLDTPSGAMIALVPSNTQLDLKAYANAAKVKSCTLMGKPDAQRLSGYVIGGISPIGQKKQLPTLIARSVEQAEWVLCNGGQRGVQVKLTPGDLAKICRADFAAISI